MAQALIRTGMEKVMKIWEAKDMEGETGKAPGTIVKIEKDGFLVQAGAGLLKILELQIPGKKRMKADAFLRGYQVEEGTMLASNILRKSLIIVKFV